MIAGPCAPARLAPSRNGAPAQDAPATHAGSPVLLIVDDDSARGRGLLDAAQARGLHAELAADLQAARLLIAATAPEVIVLNISIGTDRDAAMRFLADASAQRPVMVVADADAQVDRVEVARRGGRGFLACSLDPGDTIAAADDLRERVRVRGTRILAVDDDPIVLEMLQLVLQDAGFEVLMCADPARFWERLDESSPDLVLLDVDMPGVTGTQLCRAARNDARWADLPIIFLTSRTDGGSVRAIFDAGADDFLSKPFAGPEVVARITGRLERVRLYRALADTDSLTGLLNRRKGVQRLQTLLRLADRGRQPMSVAIVDVDHFKAINDTHGHAAGDAVLRELGTLVSGAFRGEDVVARWGGDELVVAMHAMTQDGASRRLRDLAEEIRGQRFHGGSIAVSVSVGFAQHPAHGAGVDELLHAADGALYMAKAAGRDRVVSAGHTSS